MQPLIVAMVFACIVLWVPIPKKSEDVQRDSNGENNVAIVQGGNEGPLLTALPASA